MKRASLPSVFKVAQLLFEYGSLCDSDAVYFIKEKRESLLSRLGSEDLWGLKPSTYNS